MMTKRFIYLLLLGLGYLFFPAYKVHAIINPQPSDEVLVYENNSRITDNSIFYYDLTNYGYKSICDKGICTFYNKSNAQIIFYKASENVFQEEDWKRKYYLEHTGCEGYVTQEKEFYEAYYGWKNTDEYTQAVEKFTKEAYANGIYQGISNYIEQKAEPLLVEYLHKKGFSFYGNPNCNANYTAYIENLRNISIKTENISFPESNYRTYRLDIDKSKFTELNYFESISAHGSWLFVIFIIAFVTILFVLIFFLYSKLYKLLRKKI